MGRNERVYAHREVAIGVRESARVSTDALLSGNRRTRDLRGLAWEFAG